MMASLRSLKGAEKAHMQQKLNEAVVARRQAEDDAKSAKAASCAAEERAHVAEQRLKAALEESRILAERANACEAELAEARAVRDVAVAHVAALHERAPLRRHASPQARKKLAD